MRPNSPIKLNLGCGPFGIEGWTNYDWGVLPLLSKLPWMRRALIGLGLLSKEYDAAWPSLKLVDIRKKLPLANETVQCIYCSHVLEHLERWEALHVLQESHRVLVRGGCVRVVVPNMEKLFEQYVQARQQPIDKKKVTRPALEACRSMWGQATDIKPSNWIDRLKRSFIRGHRWAYDDLELEILLREAGFEPVERREFRMGAVPDLDRLDLAEHASSSLYVEAAKPD